MKQKEKQGKRQREKDGLRAECVTPTNYCLTRAIQLLNRQKAKAILEICVQDYWGMIEANMEEIIEAAKKGRESY